MRSILDRIQLRPAPETARRDATGPHGSEVVYLLAVDPFVPGASDRLFELGVFAQGIAFPTVAKDKARVRTIVTATHTKEDP